MRNLKVSVLGGLFVCAMLLSGCDSELKDLRIQNETQQRRIADLESQLRAKQLELDQLKRELEAIRQSGGVETDALEQKIAALEDDLARKRALIQEMQTKLLGGGQLPPELDTKLKDFAAANSQFVEYNPDSGIVRFKSDLLFERGSDVVAASAIDAVKALCGILTSPEAADFNIIIAGHTDDMRIARAETLAKHPTNWHLSAHRAISVLDIMALNGVAPERMSVRGFGEFRPTEPNAPNKAGNEKNRRVEIFVIPKGI